ncbi:hypothetical protein [Polaribacter sp. SA4-12]|uniref:hypothetical protein n=1 Tax=Polaribacter sp. SA4-12 TaxID=1312072 RepID=UPI000B3CF92A|nr:hypothetical protein [Polaribacter sp. SA4-12]ARV15655.1 hypothetical protein BTO07_11130 [Polaribacter sp. SA4-12]
MKKLVLIMLCFSLTSCFYNREDEPIDNIFVSSYDPVTLDRDVFESSIVIQEEKEVVTSSKIYIINNYIFINDKRTGFHIFDNSDTANPIKKKFLKIPGATDIAVRNNILYINQATDLVVLTLNFNDFSFQVNKRLKNVFPELLSPDGEYFSENNKVVVNWIKK